MKASVLLCMLRENFRLLQTGITQGCLYRTRTAITTMRDEHALGDACALETFYRVFDFVAKFIPIPYSREEIF